MPNMANSRRQHKTFGMSPAFKNVGGLPVRCGLPSRSASEVDHGIRISAMVRYGSVTDPAACACPALTLWTKLRHSFALVAATGRLRVQ